MENIKKCPICDECDINKFYKTNRVNVDGKPNYFKQCKKCYNKITCDKRRKHVWGKYNIFRDKLDELQQISIIEFCIKYNIYYNSFVIWRKKHYPNIEEIIKNL